MISYSHFSHEWTRSVFPYVVPRSNDFRVYVNGKEIPAYTCRISAYSFNRHWPGHQRAVNQSEMVSYVNLVADEAVTVEVEPLSKPVDGHVMIKPYSKGVQAERVGNRIRFTLSQNGGYVFQIDDYHGTLYLFCNKPIECKNPEQVTHYFGKGVHFAGKITLRSHESIYVDRDALVYGCICAENAEDIHIYGNGIFDDSTEERICEPCYEPYANGNIKLYDCKNVRIEGVGFVNSAIWCVNLFHCFDVSIDAINVFGQWRYNTDGIDIVNSQRVTVKNSFVHSFDDTITVKGIERYSYESCRDMLFENCVLWCDWGKTCEIGLETDAPEYANIAFRNCDILRGGNTVCDIQNGDCAEVHDIVFDDIRYELEKAYTPYRLQRSEDAVYDVKDEIEIPYLLSVKNKRFRASYHVPDAKPNVLAIGDSRFASVHDITVSNIRVFSDEAVEAEFGTHAVRILVNNTIPTTRYGNITVKNVTLNGRSVSKEEMEITVMGNAEGALQVD